MVERVSLLKLPGRGVSVAIGSGAAVLHAAGRYTGAGRIGWAVSVVLPDASSFVIADSKGRERTFSSLDAALLQICQAVMIDAASVVVVISNMPQSPIPLDLMKAAAAKGKRLTAAVVVATSARDAAAAQFVEVSQYLDSGAAYVARSVELAARVESLNGDLAERAAQLAALPVGWELVGTGGTGGTGGDTGGGGGAGPLPE